MGDALRKTVGLWSEGSRLSADLFTPTSPRPEAGYPAILLCHGWGGLKDDLARYAEKFASGGYLVMTFDYRGWGSSDGRIIATRETGPLMEAGEQVVRVHVIREVVDPIDQATDVGNCLTYLWSEPDVDRSRIGIWGTSYGAGHAAFVAGNDDRIRAVVAQIGGFGFPEEFRSWARDRASDKVRGLHDPVVPQNGLNAVPTLKGTPDVARQVEHFQLSGAAKIRVPTLIMDAEFEELNNRLEHGWAAYMIIRQHAKAHYLTYPCKHYSFYDEYFQQSTDCALTWFNRHLKGQEHNDDA